MPDFGYDKPMTVEQLEHYRKVKNARKEQGLPVLTEQKKWDRRNGDEHPLLGMRLRDTETGSTYVVDTVSNVWLDGFYIQMAIREEGTKSHALIFWENVNSENEVIVEGIERAQNRYERINGGCGVTR